MKTDATRQVMESRREGTGRHWCLVAPFIPAGGLSGAPAATFPGRPLRRLPSGCPWELSEGTDLTSGEPLRQGLREHLQALKGVRFDHIVEQISARMPTTAEAKQLGMPKNTPLLAVFGSVREASGRSLAVVEVLLPADRHELEDAYPVA